MTNIFDITLDITPQLPTWPGDQKIDIKLIKAIKDGEHCNVTQISMTTHCGTHIDAPYHFIERGISIDKIPIKTLIGRVYVVHFPQAQIITADMLKKVMIPPRTRRILFKTMNSELWEKGDNSFYKDFVALQPDAAEYLVEKNISLVGVDYLSVAPYADQDPTHLILLKAGVVIVEGLNLAKVKGGRYVLYCLPLKIKGADGAPARAFLVGG